MGGVGCRTTSSSGSGGLEASRRGQLIPLQGLQAGECDSCPVYGTGRIHCEQSRSVNYRRAINRAETDPRVRRSSSPLPAWTSLFPGVLGYKDLLYSVPRGPVPVPSAWPILALAHFCLCLSALSNHVQCQYGKSGLRRPRLPPPASRGLCVSPVPWPIWLTLDEGTALP